MVTNYKYKYKDRLPLETVDIIKQFFIKQGYDFIIQKPWINEINTYTCHIDLTLDNKNIVLGSNGKGMSEEYALASGFAELYERFSNKLNYYFSPFVTNDYINLQYKKNNYYFDPKERFLTTDEVLNNSPIIKEAYTVYGVDNDGIQNLFSILTNKKDIIGIPYVNLENTKTIYYDPRIIYRIGGSNGMSAGNTLEEALNQAISELMERWGQTQFFDASNDTIFYEINQEFITDTALQNTINKIKQKDNDIKIYDLSYNFNIPVVLSVLIHKKNHRFYICFGSFPDFNIALERTLTELYQGIYTFDNDGIDQEPFKSYFNIANFINASNNITTSNYFPEHILYDSILVNEYNKNVYIEPNKDNQYILNYYINLCHKLNLELYYRDNSLINEVKAVHVFINNINTCHTILNYQKETSKILRKDWLNNIFIYYDKSQYIFNTIKNNNITQKEILTIIDNSLLYEFDNIPDIGNSIIGGILMTEWISLLHPSKGDIGLLTYLRSLYGHGLYYTNTITFTESEQLLKKYKLLQSYCNNKKYSIEEIQQIFNLWNEEITNEDIENAYNPKYLFYKIVIEPEINFYKNGYYLTMLNSFIKED